MKYSYLLRFFLYFLFVLAAGLVSIHVDSTLSLWATNAQIRQIYGQGDPASLALGAWQIFKHGWFDNQTVWLIHVWPPGFMLLQAAILKLFGANAPVVFILQILAAMAVASFFVFLYYILKTYVSEILALFLPLSLLLSSQFLTSMLGRDVVFGETFAISFFFIALCSLLISALENKHAFAITAGIFFALSAYFRPQYELFFNVAALLFIAAALLFLLTKKFCPKKITELGAYKKFAVIALITIGVFYIATSPFRIYNYKTMHSLSWVQTEDIVWTEQLMTTQYLMSHDDAFIVSGGGNVACAIAPNICNQLAVSNEINTLPVKTIKHEALKIFFSHPIEWLKLKCKLLPSFWSAELSIENYIFLVTLLLSIILMFAYISDPMMWLLFWINSSILGGYLGIILFVHFEARYFYFIKFYFAVTCMIYGCLYLSRLKKSPRSLKACQ